MAEANSYIPYGYVEAVAKDGRVLSTSTIVRTVVPPPLWSRGCSALRCGERYEWVDTSDSCLPSDLSSREGENGVSQELLGI